MTPATRPVANLDSWHLWDDAGLLTLELVRRTSKHKTASKFYRVTGLEAAWGLAFRLSACEGTALACGPGESYDCMLSGPESSCTCPGFIYTGGCCHLSALLGAQAEGRFGGAPAVAC